MPWALRAPGWAPAAICQLRQAGAWHRAGKGGPPAIYEQAPSASTRKWVRAFRCWSFRAAAQLDDRRAGRQPSLQRHEDRQDGFAASAPTCATPMPPVVGPPSRPARTLTDDHIGLMDHLGIDKFMVLGYCIGQPFI